MGRPQELLSPSEYAPSLLICIVDGLDRLQDPSTEE